MPDFASLLKKPVADIKRPEALPAGDYPAVIGGYELGDNNKNKTPYVRFSVKLTGWPEGTDPQTTEDGTPVDLSKKSLRRDYYLTNDAEWRLKEFLDSLGVKYSTFEDGLPQAQGAAVVAEVQQYMNQQNNEVGNQIGGLRAAT